MAKTDAGMDVPRIAVRDGQFVIDVPRAGHGIGRQTLLAGTTDELARLQRHEPIQPVEMELVIAAVEEHLAPVLRNLAGFRVMTTTDAGFRQIATIADADANADTELARASVERVFNAVADIAYGMPALQGKVPIDRAFTMRLIWLRELMHHANVEALKMTG